MKKFDVCAMGNGIVDILINVTDAELAELGWEKGSWGMITENDVAQVVGKFQDRGNTLASGGSLANSLILFTQLGGNGAFCTSIGDDQFGKFFVKEFSEIGANLVSEVTSSKLTGSCLTLITPDAERTMRVCLGASQDFSKEHVEEGVIADSEWVFLEGYILPGGKLSEEAIDYTMELAKKYNSRIALTVSAVPVIENHRDKLEQILRVAELVFANELEAKAYAQVGDLNEAIDILSDKIPHVVITAGAEGAFVCCDGAEMQIPACKCVPVDLTGAGDAFAGAYLYAFTHGYTPKEAAERATLMSREIITRKGARYNGDINVLRDIFIKA